jgi:integrase
MALFKVNTGTRDQEVCNLRWEWEIPIPELETSVFIVPRERVKNRQDRLVVLNAVAQSVVEEIRGEHPDYVFTYNGHPVCRMYNRAWKEARIRADLPGVRVHDLKHTFGCRLRAAGVSFEDGQDLLGHKSNRVTTHYSAPELMNLIQASERVSAHHWHKSGTMVILRKHVRRLRAV